MRLHIPSAPRARLIERPRARGGFAGSRRFARPFDVGGRTARTYRGMRSGAFLYA